jgi:hypothetical protein
MKKWTIQLTLLLLFAAGTFATSRIVVKYCPNGISKTELQQNTRNKIQSAVDLRGLGRHLLDLHK